MAIEYMATIERFSTRLGVGSLKTVGRAPCVSPAGGEGTDMTEANGPAEPLAVAKARLLSEPVLPEQSREDTDIAWGELPESGDDRLHRDRPPHWDDF
jgi:hypothetical protein